MAHKLAPKLATCTMQRNACNQAKRSNITVSLASSVTPRWLKRRRAQSHGGMKDRTPGAGIDRQRHGA
jgi:hypothetical protein